MKIVSIVGTRPELVQAAMVSRALRPRHREILIHTGQHYDFDMSEQLRADLDLAQPDYSLDVRSGTHAQQTGRMLIGLEEVLDREKPEAILVRGDTNSALAGALAAGKLGIPTVHIEAGERSFERAMPEEINRILIDSVSDLHLCASRTAVRNLAAEGLHHSVHWVGDVMLDAVRHYWPIARRTSTVLEQLKVETRRYALVTIHRPANTDDPRRLAQIVHNLNQIGETIVFPVHPRTRRALAALDVSLGAHVRQTAPAGYLDMLMLEANARLIATDSGGVQREAYYLNVPCLTLRQQTEWRELVEAGWNRVVGIQEWQSAWYGFAPPALHPPLYGDGTAARQIVQILEQDPPVFGSAASQRVPVSP